MVYLDSSCLLKLILLEPESEAIRQAVASEAEVVVSILTQLEAEVQLKAAHLGGRYRAARWRAYRGGLSSMLDFAPFRLAVLAGSVFETAIRQHKKTDKVHCRSLDRLHLAAMEELDVRRLMTHDGVQAAAAHAVGFSVLQPGRD
jgi:predicted nucleic acid-binding protein